MKYKKFNINVITGLLLFTVIFPVSQSQAYLQKSSESGFYNIDDGCPFPYDLSDFSTLSSISLTQISLKGVFNSPNVDITVNYTIQSNNATNQTIGLFFPFSIENIITIYAIEIDNQSIDLLTLSWRTNETIGTFPIRFTKNLNLLSLEISFSAFEEKTIFLQYSLQYHIKSYDNIVWEYRYSYFFEPLILWDNIIKKTGIQIHYEIWIPNGYLKNNGHLEYGVYSPRGIWEWITQKNENFSLIIFSSRDQNGYFEAKLIEFGYQDSFSIISPEVSFIILIIIILMVFSLLIASMIVFYRKVNKLFLNENLGI